METGLALQVGLSVVASALPTLVLGLVGGVVGLVVLQEPELDAADVGLEVALDKGGM